MQDLIFEPTTTEYVHVTFFTSLPITVLFPGKKKLVFLLSSHPKVQSIVIENAKYTISLIQVFASSTSLWGQNLMFTLHFISGPTLNEYWIFHYERGPFKWTQHRPTAGSSNARRC